MQKILPKQTGFSFLHGGGEMGQLMRSKDWSQSPVGTPDTWPQSLRTTLSIILNSKFPMFLFWGPELVCFYNDAYRPSLGKEGKHPAILGSRGEDYWQEIWTVIKPLIDQVLGGGEATWSEDQLIPIYRNGRIEDVYWTFSYSPVYDESGQPAGVFVTCKETTDRVITRKKLEQSEQQIRNLLAQTPIPMVVFTGPEHIIEVVNSAMQKRWNKTEKDVVNKKFIDVFPKMKTERIPGLLDEVYRTGVKYKETESISYIQDESGKSIQYVDFEYTPVTDANGKVTGIIAIVNDVTERVEARMKIEKSEQRFRLLADFMPQHIWTTDNKGIPTYISESLFNFSGISFEQMEREGWFQTVHPDDREATASAWKKSILTGEEFHVENRMRRHDGEYRWHLSRAVPQLDGQRNVQMWVGTSTDIHEIKKTEQLKDDFIKVASHELKTPVTTISGYIQLLMRLYKDSPDTMLAGSLATVDKHVSKFTRLVTEMLDVSKIESGNLRLQKEHFYINNLLEEVIDDVSITSPSHQVSFEPAADVIVFADKSRISQVMTNLLINAIKYSPQADRVIVTTDMLPGQIRISFRDFGIGIEPDDQQKIFQRFYRVQGNRNSSASGFGIGLFIVKEIILNHHGDVWVESEKNKGSVFTFSLPLDASKTVADCSDPT